MYVAISVVLSVGIILAYNYFTTSNTPTTSASSSDLPADVPIGTMVPYAGKDIPAGWLACNNASYPTTTYPELFAKIGYTYGMDDTKYRVPDTRGVFMRGIDATATRDTNRPAGSIQLSGGPVPDPNSIFTGASVSATGGVGYVPAPLAGQQSYVLTGGGQWSGPQYWFGTSAGTSPPSIANASNTVPFTVNMSAGTAIKQLTPGTFSLAAGNMYKCCCVITTHPNGATNIIYGWMANNGDIGVQAQTHSYVTSDSNNMQATAYVAAVDTTTVYVRAYYFNGVSDLSKTWCSIEIVR